MLQFLRYGANVNARATPGVHVPNRLKAWEINHIYANTHCTVEEIYQRILRKTFICTCFLDL